MPPRRSPYAAQMQSLKNSLKRAQGELDGLRRSDAVRVRGEDEAAMLAWLDKQPDAAATRARHRRRAGDAARGDGHARPRPARSPRSVRRRSCCAPRSPCSACAIERAKPDAERESGYQQRDETLIAGQLKQVQRRYAPAVEKALLAHLLRPVPRAAGRAAPAGIRRGVRHARQAEVATKLDALYAGTKLGDEAERLAHAAATRKRREPRRDPMLVAAKTLTPALPAHRRRAASSATANCCACARRTCAR